MTSGSDSQGAALAAVANFEENSPNDEVLAPLFDQAESRHVPERRRAAVAEHDLVAVGEAEQIKKNVRKQYGSTVSMGMSRGCGSKV